MQLIRQLDNGKSVRRDDANRLWLYDEHGVLVGQIERASTAANLLALTPQDFGDVPDPASVSTVSVAGPVAPQQRRQPFPWYRRAMDRLRGR